MANNMLRLERLILQNYRRFIALEIGFHERLTVVVARNGCGKTAVLDAIAVALGPFIGAFDNGKGVHFSTSDVRLARNLNVPIGEMEAQYPLRMEAIGLVDGREETWIRELATAKSHTTYGEARSLINFGKYLQRIVRNNADGMTTEIPILPLVSYYGTGRLWSEKRLTSGKKSTDAASRMAGYMDCLDSSSRYRIFSDWFERLCRMEFEERESAQKLKEVQSLLKAIRSAVDKVLAPSGWTNISFKSSELGIVAEHPSEGSLPVQWLSDGIRNLIGLAADIAHRAVRLNSHLGSEAVRKTPGIVMIDEVDMHLHPEWQQIILSSLLEAYPSIQFIVTTHSPQVLTTVKAENIRLISDQVAKRPSFNPYGRVSADALEGIMEVAAAPASIELTSALDEYKSLVGRGQHTSSRALELRKQLEAEWGAEDNSLKALDIIIRKNEFLAKTRGG
ncbi:MAG: AAA family ATPase [Verrucomicrobiota bacterium]|jgi:predicted ATP-binding protein involved in virulence